MSVSAVRSATVSGAVRAVGIMYQDDGITKLQNKFESSISELKKKTFVTAADVESYGEIYNNRSMIELINFADGSMTSHVHRWYWADKHGMQLVLY